MVSLRLSWLSLVEMAQLSDESEYQRMRQVATAAAAAVQTRSITSADDDAWRLTAEQLSTVTNLQFELLDLSGSPQAIPAASVTSTAAEAASRSPNAPYHDVPMKVHWHRYGQAPEKFALTPTMRNATSEF